MSDREPATGTPVLVVDDDVVHLPDDVDPELTYDVLLNGGHVWSLQPARDAEERRGQAVVPWPKALRRHLVGRAEVVLREHADQVVVATGRHVFRGAEDRRVEVTDSQGNHLILDKYGRLTRPLSAEDPDSVDAFLGQVDALLTTLREEAGLPSFICYGTLLGAVRNGRLIGHDNDVDVAYLSDQRYPVDVVREGFHVERVLREHGWHVRRGSGSRINVRIEHEDGSHRFVDVFAAHWVDDRLYMPQDTGFDIPPEQILPLTTVELHGRPFPAPADYEQLLALTYGPGWRVPDPSFKYETPLWLSRRLNGWFGGLRTNRKYWDAFYAGSGRKLPTKPTTFARWVAEHYPSTRPLVDLGAGNLRDSRWFVRNGRSEVLAVDYTGSAMRHGRKPGKRLHRELVNLNDTRHVLSLGVRLSRHEPPVDLYGRFLLNTLDADGLANVVRLASMSLRSAGYLFLEFRTVQDAGRPKHFPNQKRVFLDPDDVAALIESARGRVVHRESGTGLAPFEDEDPHVCRIVAAWSDQPDGVPDQHP
ncbi:LicD family protein [Nocardioides sp.]|uniref:LicD family protein n=1 Tax=Nocardioides sp. TaxID=35761 RepID=UPI0037845A03